MSVYLKCTERESAGALSGKYEFRVKFPGREYPRKNVASVEFNNPPDASKIQSSTSSAARRANEANSIPESALNQRQETEMRMPDRAGSETGRKCMRSFL